MPQILRHLQSDEAASYDDGALGGMLVYPGADLSYIRDAPHREDARQVDARDRRSDGSRAWGQQQGIFEQAGALPGHALQKLIDEIRALDMAEVRAKVDGQAKTATAGTGGSCCG
jgi:hypothetical protein